MLAKTTALILNSRKYGDSSKILSAYTKDFGKISLIAKGCRTAKSKFGGSLEPLSWVDINFYNKSNEQIQLLASADIVKPFNKLTSSLEHLASGLLIAESISTMQADNHINKDLFDYTTRALSLLNGLPNNSFNLFIATQFKLAESLGFWLQFDFMIDEGESSEKFAFSIEDGSPAPFASDGKNRFIINRDLAISLERIFKLSLDDVCSVELDMNQKKIAINFFAEYFSYHLERKIHYKSSSLVTL